MPTGTRLKRQQSVSIASEMKVPPRVPAVSSKVVPRSLSE